MEKRFWVFPDHFDAMRAAVRLRYDLSPYIYAASREAYDTGISMCRPLYYEYPEEERAYTCSQEYFFGNDILATVVCEPVDKVTGLASRTMWFPSGNDWYDVSTGRTYAGGTEAVLHYTIDENPYFVKAGAVIPMASPSITSLQEGSNELYLFVAPGAGESETKVYEDDGATQAYKSEYALTTIRKSSDAQGLRLQVGAREGQYVGMAPDRRVRVVLEGIYCPKSVRVNGVELAYSRFAAHEQAGWGYDGNTLAATLYLPASAAGTALEIEVVYGEGDASRLNGKKGLIGRALKLIPEVKYMFATYVSDRQLPKPFLNLAQCGSFITEDPAQTGDYLDAADPEATVSLMATYPKMPAPFQAKVKAQLTEF